MSLDPLKTTQKIVDRYLNYIYTTFSFKNKDLQNQFQRKLYEENKFFKGPILEATPPFQKGKTINDLIDEGLLSSEFKNLNATEELPLDRTLYLHQEKAIRKIISEKRNIIVATGTGSGKTESFLIPIINYLFEQKRDGRLTPGVRALILYPMNALANDQLKRLRKLLKNYADITFGSYTGETPENYNYALEEYQMVNEGQQPLKNELISREEMKSKPPHILLTNYAMLEYLMLRPEDHIFFDGEYADQWKYLVIDEVHTYTGAKAIEMSMLIRRLKKRVMKKRRLCCIATSATIGNREKDYPLIANFGQKLFGEKFEYIIDDPLRQDIVKVDKIKMNYASLAWGKPKDKLYRGFAKIIESKEHVSQDSILEELITLAKKEGVPDRIINASKGKISGTEWKRFLYDVLAGDQRVMQLQNLLEASPQLLHELAKIIFNEEKRVKDIIDLVYVTNKARASQGQQPLLPARYHLFIRAIEGAFLSFLPEKKLYLERKEYHEYNDKEIPVFEIATCYQCGSLYLVGETQEINGRRYLKQPGKEYYKNRANLEYYLVIDEDTNILIDNEDEIVSGGNYNNSKEYKLCPLCGAIAQTNLFGDLCDCDTEHIKLLKASSKKGLVHKCSACGNTRSQGSIVWRFLLGGDAVSSVLATSLYQQLPPLRKHKKQKLQPSKVVWSVSGDTMHSVLDDNQKKARQLLIFADSRQDAAFFAPYLENTYNSLVRKQIILRVIKENKNSVLKNRWNIKDLVNHLKGYLAKINLYPEKSLQELEDIAWKWVLYEFLSIEGRNSLSALGLLSFQLRKPTNIQAPPFQSDPWNLSEEEVWVLFQVLLEGFRRYGAISFPENVSPQDEFFVPRNREYFFKSRTTGPNIFSWSPSSAGVLNSRLDFLIKLARKKNINVSRKECEDLLNQIWDFGLAIEDNRSLFRNYFSSIVDKKQGTLYRMKLDYWEIVPGIISGEINWYYCPVCNKITHYNINNVCPTYRCEGTLEKCNPEILYQDNHYRKTYLMKFPERMKVSEHTAQLTTEAAANIQRKFNNGDINILSCSTTFELGVDVGELEAVFMRNVPPTASNYIQRAGRAGRRTDSTAFALTYARRRPHDLSNYNEPFMMINGAIKPPYFEMRNVKIIKRHLYATALAFFWKKYPDYFGSVEDFFFHDRISGPQLFYEYLLQKPEDLKEHIMEVVPSEMHNILKVKTWGWINELYDQEEGILYKTERHLRNDIEQLEKARDENVAAKRYKKADAINRSINTLKGKYLINFLSQNNIIPKYGFPVDVVNLQINHHEDIAHNLELSRDLKVALSEYAPDSEVIAGGKLWTSRYLKKLPDKELLKYDYAICDNCGNYQSKLHETGERYQVCEACGEKLGKNTGTFIVPEFGFISEKSKKPTMARPERTYSTRQYFTGKASTDESTTLNLNGINVELIAASNGTLAIINHAGFNQFSVCKTCGHAIINRGEREFKHKTPWNTECNGYRERVSLGYEFMTDILQVRFLNSYFGQDQKGFWNSVLYGILEGISSALGIERKDIDGCLYPYTGNPLNPALVFFDSVPGGAGHVKRIIKDDNFIEVLRHTLQIVKSCKCGGVKGESSCYGCLRNYENQYCHDELKRGIVIDFMQRLLL